MPVIPIESDDWAELALVVSRLCVDPQSPLSTASLSDELEGNVVAEAVRQFGLENIRPTEREFELVHKAGYKRLKTIDDNRIGLRDAGVAGQVLFRAVRLAHYAPTEASIGKAQKIVECLLKNSPQPLGIKSIKASWSRFKSVSHFIVAPWLILPMMRAPAQLMSSVQKMEADGELRPIRRNFHANESAEVMQEMFEIEDVFTDAVKNLYAAAEKVGAFCGERYAPGQRIRKRPLVNPDAMWSIPSQFKLPEVELAFGPPLTEVELSVLRRCK